MEEQEIGVNHMVVVAVVVVATASLSILNRAMLHPTVVIRRTHLTIPTSKLSNLRSQELLAVSGSSKHVPSIMVR